MRAKNELKFLAEAYDTKLILERVVDGTLMCPEACCGAPVMECKCGPDCEHCNCHEIQKLKKEEDAEEFDGPGMQWDGIDDYDAELPAGHYDTHVRLQRGGRWNAHTVNVRKTDKELIQKFLDQGFRIVKPFDEDNEGHPAGGIRSFREKPPRMDAFAKAALEEMARLRELDLNKWEDYIKNNPRTGVDDIMKKVHKQFKQSPPSRYSRDYDIVWKNKVRPWLKEHEGNL